MTDQDVLTGQAYPVLRHGVQDYLAGEFSVASIVSTVRMIKRQCLDLTHPGTHLW